MENVGHTCWKSRLHLSKNKIGFVRTRRNIGALAQIVGADLRDAPSQEGKHSIPLLQVAPRRCAPTINSSLFTLRSSLRMLFVLRSSLLVGSHLGGALLLQFLAYRNALAAIMLLPALPLPLPWRPCGQLSAGALVSPPPSAPLSLRQVPDPRVFVRSIRTR